MGGNMTKIIKYTIILVMLLLGWVINVASAQNRLKGASDMQWSPNGQQLAIADYNGIIYIANNTGVLLRTLNGHSDSVYAVAWSPDGQILASGGESDRFVYLWDSSNWLLQQRVYPALYDNGSILYGGVGNLAWRPDGNYLMATAFDTFQFWQTGSWTASEPSRTGSVLSAEWSPNGALLAATDIYALVLFNGQTMTIDNLTRDDIQINGENPQELSWSSDSQLLAVTDRLDPRISIWDVPTRTRIGIFTMAEVLFKDVVFIASDRVATITETGTIYILNTTGTIINSYETGATEVRTLAWNATLQVLAIGGENTVVSEAGILGLSIIPLRDVLPPTPTATNTPTIVPTSTPTNTATPTLVIPPSFAKLRLTSMCSADPALTRRWRVRNSNAFPLPFTWEIYGNGQAGSGVAVANGDVFFESNTVNGANTLRLFVGGRLQEVKASGGARCP
jgi:WD40 repeat protein